MTHKLKFPIKFKLILAICFIIISTTALYLYIALDLYKKDKTAYIFDSTLSTATSLATNIENVFDQATLEINILGQTFEKKHFKTIKTLFKNSKNLTDFTVFSSKGKKLYRISSKEFQKVTTQFPTQTTHRNELSIKYIKAKNLEFIQFSIQSANKKYIYLARILPATLIESFQSDSTFENMLVSTTGQLLAHNDLDHNPLGENWVKRNFIKEIITSNLLKGVLKAKIHQNSCLIAYSQLKKYKFYVISLINEEKSFAVISSLIDKTLFTALFVVSLAIILSIFLSKFFTSPIEKLVEATTNLAKGEFGTRIQLNSNDEIGVLSKSFNHMSGEIERYTHEMEDKIRMENELNVAKIVQSSFFPEEELSLDGAYLSSFYRPASECGGDWWGNILTPDKNLILMIADATGHGVPAALATATANCCANSLQELATIDPSYYQSSSKIVQFFNRAISDDGSDILMTFFVAIINFQEQTICYTNAGHNPALLCNYNTPPTKQNIISLNQATGLRLGVDKSAKFTEEKISYQNNSFLTLFTDGLIEGSSSKKDSWNLRRFYKTIIERIDYHDNQLRDQIIDNALLPNSEESPDDDITLVTAHLRNQTKSNFKTPSKNKYIASKDNRDKNIETIYQSSLSHLIGENQPDTEWEKEQLLKNTLCFESFFCENETFSTTIKSSNEIIAQVDALVDRIHNTINHQNYKNFIRTIAIELASNAVYNAPIDKRGDEKYSSTSRTYCVKLLSDEYVKLQIAANDRYLGVSVTDHFGKLTKKQLVDSIRRGVNDREHLDKRGGAGLGLYMVYSYAHKLLVQRILNKKLTITALIHNTKRFKSYKEVNTSFHFSEKDFI